MEVNDRFRTAAVWFVILWFAGALVSQMGQPLWWDEIFTMRFIEAGPYRALTDDYHSNNHRFFTLMAQGSVAALGTHEWVLRLPSVLPAIAALLMLARYLLRAYSVVATTVAISILGFSPLLLHWLPQARGYGLTLFASTLLILAATALLEPTEDLKTNTRAALLGLCAAGVVGISTLPHFILPFSLVAVGILLVGPKARRLGVFISTASAVAISSVVYLLGLSDRMFRLASGTRGEQMDLVDSVRGPFRFLVVGEFSGQGVLRQLVGSQTTALAVASLIALLCFVGTWSATAHRRRVILTVAVAPLFGTFSLFAVLGMTVSDRTLLFLLPQLGVLVAGGVRQIEHRAPSRCEGSKVRAAVMGTLLIGLASVLLQSGTMVQAWLKSPIEDFAEPVRIAMARDGFDVVTDSRYNRGFRHYGGEAVAVMAPDEVDDLVCGERSKPVAYIHQSIGRSEPLPTSCFEDAGAIEWRIPQRTRGEMTVWFIEAGGES